MAHKGFVKSKERHARPSCLCAQYAVNDIKGGFLGEDIQSLGQFVSIVIRDTFIMQQLPEFCRSLFFRDLIVFSQYVHAFNKDAFENKGLFLADPHFLKDFSGLFIKTGLVANKIPEYGVGIRQSFCWVSHEPPPPIPSPCYPS